ncbi:MAG: M20/M25/M40 family metallo-hydrolase, partial [Actinomycetota bacterium]
MGFDPHVLRAIGTHVTKRGIALGETYDVVGRLRGTENSRAIMLVAHYDSVPRAPGAADDAAGVAAILETARALRAGAPLKNDVIVLLTDGEEAGLLGADAFATSHPWMKDVGLIMNFEARGNKGPSLLFETGTGNASLIKALAQSASHPVGSSLFYSLYKLLPNDTDFTVFRRQNIPGLNFAFGENLEAYHSQLDTPGALSLSSLQHHGSYALDLTRQFGSMDLTKLTNQKSDDVFFDWVGSVFMVYGQFWVIPGEMLVSVGLFALIFVSIRRGELRPLALLLASLWSILFLVLIPAVLAAAYWVTSRALSGRMIAADSQPNTLLLIGFVLLGVCTGTLLFTLGRRRFAVRELSLAGLIELCVFSWAVALVLPAGSYVLFWPLLVTVVALLVAALRGAKGTFTSTATALLGMAATVLIFAPILYLLYIFLTLQLITAVSAGLLIGMAFLFCGPFLETAIPQTAWRLIGVILTGSALITIAAGITLSKPSPSHP